MEIAAKKMWWDPRPAKDVWTEQVLEEAIANLMQNLGWTREQAEQAIRKPKGKSIPDAGPLKL